MAYHARKTEHAGPKGSTRKSAYWGKRVDAKKESNRARRINDRREVGQAMSVADRPMNQRELAASLIAGGCPEFVKMCDEADAGDTVVLSQVAFSSTPEEMFLLAMAVKYAGARQLTLTIGPDTREAGSTV